MRTTTLALLALVAPCLAIAAEPAATSTAPATAPAKPTQVKLTIHAKAPAQPSLRYRLLPEIADRTPGNAAILYTLAGEISSGNAPGGEEDDKVSKWLDLPVDQIPREEADKVAGPRGSMRYVELAARRDECHWDLPYRIEGFNTLLPHLSPMRQTARLLALRARLQIADGKYEEAAHTLQTGFSMGQDLNRDAFLVQILVAAGVDELMLRQVEFWASRPGAPNLYWALSDLPRPMCDIRAGLQHERAGTIDTLPHFRDALAGRLTEAQLGEMLNTLEQMKGNSGEGPAAKVEQIATVMAMAPTARKYLSSIGYTERQLDAMTPTAAIGLYLAKEYDIGTQESFKFASLPYWQGGRLGAGREEELKRQTQNPLMAVVMPATNRAVLTALQATRHVEELRAIEAIRAYAAAHGGQPPGRLADVTDLPIPIDPVTGEPFAYTPRDGGFTLDAPIPPSGSARHGQHYDVTLEK